MFGMSDCFGLVGLESVENRYLDGRAVANCSEETKTEIDREIVRIMKERYEIAKQLLNDNRDALDEISEFLIDRETITGDEFMEIFNRVRESRNNQEEKAGTDEEPEAQTADGQEGAEEE
ncbi:MAG: AAA family ATPase, partial [Candidatus Ornithomonoglobus sp.]